MPQRHMHHLRLAQEQLEEISKQINFILKVSQVGTWEWDVKTNKVVRDEAMHVLFGLDPEHAGVSMGLRMELVHPDDKIKVNQILETCIRDKKPYQLEFRVVWPDQSIHTLEVRGEPILNSFNDVERIIGVAWDISERKQLEHDRLQALEEAKEQQKLRLGEAEEGRKRFEEFIHTIFHEIRNPLQGMFGCANLLSHSLQQVREVIDEEFKRSHSEKYEKLIKALQTAEEERNLIEQCALQQKQILDQVLDYSKINLNKVELNLSPFRFEQLVTKCVGLFKAQFEKKKLDLKVNLTSELNYPIKADPYRLSQVLNNLLSNAVKFTKQGEITITAFLTHQTENLAKLNISVQDTGIGMTSVELERLFDYFVQANERIASEYGGSGLGLIISKKLVEDVMGGTLSVSSKKSQGTCFTIEIPCFLEGNRLQQANSEISVSPKKDIKCVIPILAKSKNFLIVEDNEINQKIMSCYLDQIQCSYQIAKNGQDALQKVDEANFDIIFMDLEMPIMCGIEAIMEIRKKESQHSNSKRTPIIGISGNSMNEKVHKAMKVGLDAFISKPFYKEELFDVIQQFL